MSDWQSVDISETAILALADSLHGKDMHPHQQQVKAAAMLRRLAAELKWLKQERAIFIDVLMAPSEPDVIRLHREKMDQYMLRLAAEAEIARLKGLQS